MENSNVNWQYELKKIIDDFGNQGKIFFIPYGMANCSYGNILLHDLYVAIFESSIESCKENEPDAMIMLCESCIIDKPTSINKTLSLLINLYKLYIEEYNKRKISESWQGKLENLFDIFVHQNTLEYAADYMADFSCEDKTIHNSYIKLLEIAIENCKEHRNDAMNAINNGSGYTPKSDKEALDLLTELHELYLQEYKSHISALEEQQE